MLTVKEIIAARKFLDDAPMPEDGRKMKSPLTKRERKALGKLASKSKRRVRA